MKNLVIVSHFQSAGLTEEIIVAIKSQAAENNAVIFIRTSPVRVTKNNPLDFESRKLMLQVIFPGMEIYELPDRPSAKSWSEELDKKSREVFPEGEIEICGEKNLAQQYQGNLRITRQVLPGISPGKTTVSSSEDFRAGMIYAANYRYASALPTVDIAIMKDGKLLLGRKPHQEKFRFIGGFADPADENFEASAIREAEEETGLKVGNLKYIGSAKIDDWRYRDEEDKIITSFFSAEIISGEAKANDDIKELKWFSLEELTEDDFVKEHHVLFRMLKK